MSEGWQCRRRLGSDGRQGRSDCSTIWIPQGLDEPRHRRLAARGQRLHGLQPYRFIGFGELPDQRLDFGRVTSRLLKPGQRGLELRIVWRKLRGKLAVLAGKRKPPLLFVQLGQLVLHVLKQDRYMRAWYRRIRSRRGSSIARVAVMRRLLTIYWHMLKHNEPYYIGGPPRLRLKNARRPEATMPR